MSARNRFKFFLAGRAFEAVNPRIPGHPHERLVELVGAGPVDRVLELCGGTGYAARNLAQRLPAAEVHSLDISPEMQAVGRKKLESGGVTNVTLVNGDAGELPFPDDSFDAVMSVFGLHELPTAVRDRAIRETKRVLEPGGRLVVVDLDRPPTARAAFEVYLRITERAHAREG